MAGDQWVGVHRHGAGVSPGGGHVCLEHTAAALVCVAVIGWCAAVRAGVLPVRDARGVEAGAFARGIFNGGFSERTGVLRDGGITAGKHAAVDGIEPGGGTGGEVVAARVAGAGVGGLIHGKIVANVGR